MKSLFFKASVLSSIAAILVLCIAGCNDKITQVPVIESKVVTPDTVMAGDSASIQLLIKDADDTELVIYYTTTGGTIVGIGDTVSWKAPDKAGRYMTQILVTDKDGNQAYDSVYLVVLKNDTAARIEGVAAFPSGIKLDLADSKVRLYSSKENLKNHIFLAETKTRGFGSIVNFEFSNVVFGTYYLDTWKDTDFGNTLNAGDYYGWYGNGDIAKPNPNSFTIDSATVKSINIQMWVTLLK